MKTVVPPIIDGTSTATNYVMVNDGTQSATATGVVGGSFYVESTSGQNNFFSVTYGGMFSGTPTSITFSNITKSHASLTIARSISSQGGLVCNVMASGVSAGTHYLFANITAIRG